MYTLILLVLFAFDPEHLLTDDSSGSVRWPAVGFPPAPTTWATTQSPAVVQRDRAWLGSSGLGQILRFTGDLSQLQERIKAMPLRHIDWPSLRPPCAVIDQDIDAFDALGSLPHVEGRQAWEAMKRWSRAATDALCRQWHDPREFQVLLNAAGDIGNANAEVVTAMRVLLHYQRAG